jgi:hypothetical protein
MHSLCKHYVLYKYVIYIARLLYVTVAILTSLEGHSGQIAGQISGAVNIFFFLSLKSITKSNILFLILI